MKSVYKNMCAKASWKIMATTFSMHVCRCMMHPYRSQLKVQYEMCKKFIKKTNKRFSFFFLQIQGCDAEIEEKQGVTYDRRKGTTYVLHPGPGGAPLNGGTELQIKVIGKTWARQRGFKRPVIATFSSFNNTGPPPNPMPMCG